MLYNYMYESIFRIPAIPSVPMPYVRLYSYYLFAMIDFLTSDYDRYKISSEMFEKTIEAYAKWYMRNGEA